MKTSSQADALPKFKLANLELGDILFCTDPAGSESRAIRTATGSPFSHVAIYKGEMNFLEAADYGVVNFNVMRFGIRSKANIAVYRLKTTVPNAAAVAAKAAEAAEKYRELEYWTPGAILSAFKRLKKLGNWAGFWLPAREKGFFCSYLVAQSYGDAGISLCPGLAPHEIHPGDLLRSPHLANVTGIAIADLPDWDRRTDVIDGGSRETPFQRFTTARRELLEDVQKLMAAAGAAKPATLDDVLGLVVLDENADRQKHLDAVISAHLKAGGFTTLPLAYTSEAGPSEPGLINGVPYIDIPRTTLESTIALHAALRDKWRVRLDDVGQERAAGNLIRQQVDLELLDVWDRYYDSFETALRSAIAQLDQTSKELAAYIATLPANEQQTIFGPAAQG